MPDPYILSVFNEYQTSEKGLSKNEVKNRHKQHGLNKLKVKKSTPLWRHFLEEFTDLMVLILIFAATISLFAGEEKDAIVIYIIVLINALIGFVQKFRAEKAIEALKKLVAPTANVIRDNEEIEIDAQKLVPGDILILREGDRISADAILIEANELQTQEATLTGESTPVAKTITPPRKKVSNIAEQTNRIFTGTLIAHGSGKAIVTATGMKTEFGKIAKLTTETKKEKSPLQKEMFRIGVFVGKVTFFISAILFAVGIVFQGEPIVKAFLFATAVAVAAVPEGLPATITIALAMGVQRLAKKNAIVKQLASVETLGSTTVICSDKTGTLTRNEMTVKAIITPYFTAKISGAGYNPSGTIEIFDTDNNAENNTPLFTLSASDQDNKDSISLNTLNRKSPEHFTTLEQIHTISLLCNNASLKNPSPNQWNIIGDPTEGALLTLAEKINFNSEVTRKQNNRVYEFPFDSKRKRMTIITENKSNNKQTALIKGAPDSIIEICSHVYHNGKLIKLTNELKTEILEQNASLAKQALRTIGFAMKELPKTKHKLKQEEVENDLIFIGIVGMIDPPRKSVKEAVHLAREAGINTYIITGDHGLTAEAIAKQIGMIGERNHTVITGAQLHKLSENQLLKELQTDQDIIFARVDPEHKLRIVNTLKKLDHVIAVTGDGVNDAPALKKADIGIAMGITGTDVSKEAANMILTDDSYSTIVNAIKEGRTIYQNLRKFVFYIFSCNIGELTTIFAAIILNMPAPLTAVLILAVDIGTDILPALALGIDPTEKGIMKLPPRDPKKKIMDLKFNLRFLYLGLVIGTIVVSTYIYTLYSYGWNFGQPLGDDDFIHLKGSTMAFTILVLIQMVNTFNARSENKSAFQVGLFSNHYLLGAITISILTVIAFVEVPFFQNWLHTVSLTSTEWTIAAVGSFSIFIIEELRKLIFRAKAKNKATK